MPGKYNLNDIRKEIQDKIDLDRIANPDVYSSAIGKIQRELEKMPIKVMVDQLQYIDQNLLPAVKRKGGDQSADYIFFSGLRDTLIWMLTLKDRFDLLSRWYGHKVFQLDVVTAEAEFLKRELDKYQAVEDMWLTGSLEYILTAVKRKAENLKDNGKK